MVYSDPQGAADLSTTSVRFESVRIQRTLSVGLGAVSRCEIYYDAASGLLNLYYDAGIATTTLSPGSGSIANS